MEPFWPLTVFAYCPKCGQPGAGARSIKQYVCEACGFQYFQNAASAAVAVIRDAQGRVLFTRRAKEPAKGLLDLPGGFVDPLETGEQAVVRELLEETGLHVEVARYLTSSTNRYDYAGVTYYSTDQVFECRALDPTQASALDETTEIVFGHPADIALDEIGFETIRNVVRWLIDHDRQQET